MTFNFDLSINRDQSGSVKFDGRRHYFGRDDVMPLWVADMDFAAPDCVISALQKRLDHPVFGYALYPDSLYQATIDWFSRRHGWNIQREWILMAPGVVPALCAAIQASTAEGDGVIVQPPVYFPFFSAVTANQRKPISNPLRRVNNHYEIDFFHLESCARAGARLLALCTPHNPVGRVWSAEELERLLAIARSYDMTIFSDDIHCDLAYSNHTHMMLARLAEPSDKIITAVAPNKTFNIPGLGLSAVIIPNEAQRDGVKAIFERSHMSNMNPFSIAAYEAAYRNGDQWLDALLDYLEVTRNRAVDFILGQIPEICVTKPEATYLLWLDCRALGLSDSALRDFFINECKLGLSPGAIFGEGGQGFMRMNIGTPRRNVMNALQQIRSGVDKLMSR